ncbi:hypothetical protein FA15DRAFT_709554 [Coprinopsis marcescibilis]|uniref:Uncharacterized protein n=1 Tax=Coprinopsis marcescibilis TaxID=230819 RepID=A0A5C3KFH3_COPMA|nr:hypothetical protein FA15DRAFT_709554 [Coprinopsis marcescibilis]
MAKHSSRPDATHVADLTDPDRTHMQTISNRPSVSFPPRESNQKSTLNRHRYRLHALNQRWYLINSDPDLDQPKLSRSLLVALLGRLPTKTSFLDLCRHLAPVVVSDYGSLNSSVDPPPAYRTTNAQWCPLHPYPSQYSPAPPVMRLKLNLTNHLLRNTHRILRPCSGAPSAPFLTRSNLTFPTTLLSVAPELDCQQQCTVPGRTKPPTAPPPPSYASFLTQQGFSSLVSTRMRNQIKCLAPGTF